MTDLGRWLSGEYRVAGPELGDPEADGRTAGADEQDEHE
jgi:endogenous inhibitor of DNA gyrase (YacG/DUF329 family)